jgi:hypothetical protein
MKSRKIRRAMYVACTGEKRNACTDWVGRLEEKNTS